MIDRKEQKSFIDWLEKILCACEEVSLDMQIRNVDRRKFPGIALCNEVKGYRDILQQKLREGFCVKNFSQQQLSKFFQALVKIEVDFAQVLENSSHYNSDAVRLVKSAGEPMKNVLNQLQKSIQWVDNKCPVPPDYMPDEKVGSISLPGLSAPRLFR